MLEEAGPEAKREDIQSIYEWLKEEYESRTGITVGRYSPEKSLDDAFNDLISAVRPGISNEINSRYQKAY